MTEEERFAPVFESWLHDTDMPAPDAGHGVRQVQARLAQTRQLGRWRWLPSFQRHSTIPPTTTDTSEYQPSPISATKGHTPTVIGRTQLMLSPGKALIAGALVFGIGGVMLIARPFQQQSSAPGAEVQPPPAPTAFTATYSGSGRSNTGVTTEHDDGTIVAVGNGWLFDSRESSDPRFAGPLVLTVTDITYPGLGGGIDVGGWRIETDEGAWQQFPPETGPWFEEDTALWASGQLPPADNIQFYTFIGEGAYEGLTAVVQETWWPGGVDGLVQLDGYVFEGGLPDAPEPWVP